MIRVCFSAFIIAALALGCEPQGTADSSAPTDASNPEAAAAGSIAESGNTIVAELNGVPISEAELTTHLKEELWEQQTEELDESGLYELRSTGLDRLIQKRLIEAAAAKEGLTAEELLTRESEKVGEVTEAEVQSFYEENAERFGEASFDDMSERIGIYLGQLRRGESIEKFVSGLRVDAGVAVNIEPPRIPVDPTGPSMGPADAPITLVEFSDYECPFCKRAEPTVKQVMERYKGKIRLVYRHYPLEFHARAKPAAEAAACADDQGKFWEYHKLIFTDVGGSLAAEDLEKVAEKAGLDLNGFKACVSENRFAEQVNVDTQAGAAAGVNGTPHFFINGIPLSGAQPLSAFTRVIDAELARVGGDS